MVTSSMIRSFVCRRSFPVTLFLEKSQREVSLILMGTFSFECRVLPFWRSFDATALIAVPRAMWPSLLTADSKAFSTNVLPVPPGASRKNRPPYLSLMATNTFSKKVFCSTFICLYGFVPLCFMVEIQLLFYQFWNIACLFFRSRKTQVS